MLDDPSNELYPDMMLLEVGYVQKYVQSDYLMSLRISASQMLIQQTSSLTISNLVLTRMAFRRLLSGRQHRMYPDRADLAEKYLGTTDQAELEKTFSSWDSILEAARKVNDASGGKVNTLLRL